MALKRLCVSWAPGRRWLPLWPVQDQTCLPVSVKTCQNYWLHARFVSICGLPNSKRTPFRRSGGSSCTFQPCGCGILHIWDMYSEAVLSLLQQGNFATLGSTRRLPLRLSRITPGTPAPTVWTSPGSLRWAFFIVACFRGCCLPWCNPAGPYIQLALAPELAGAAASDW